MSEFIVIQVGQCGNQIGARLLPEILEEFDRKEATNVKTNHCMSSFFHCNSKKSNNLESLNDLIKNKAKARFICIDMEDSVVARFKIGPFRTLYDKKNLITNYPGSGNNWAEGYCNHGRKYEQKILKVIQYNLEQCENLNGFVLLFSVGGGTGSGLGTFILKLLTEHYPNIERFVVCVYPIGTEDVITCPYNMVFATNELINNATCVFPMENRSLMEIVFKETCSRYSNLKPTSLFKPFEDLNSIIVNMILHLTSGARFPGSMNVDINEINTNMVPFPKLNFLSSGFSPFTLVKPSHKGHSKQMKTEIFLSSCSRNNQLIKVDPLDSRRVSMSATILGRGKYSINDMRIYTEKLKTKLHFAPWSSKAIKIGLCHVPPKGLDYTIFSLFNTTSTANLYEEIIRQFMKLYQRKAHIHHYTTIPGFDIDHFKHCQENLIEIIQCYKDIEKMKY